MPNVSVTIYTLVSLMVLKVLLADDEIKCFCDRFSCPGSLMCSGKWCLIGINADDGNVRSIDQRCGWNEVDRPVDCSQNFDRWAEVCACDEPLCNTFAYLRSHMDQQAALQAANGHSYSSDTKKYTSNSELTRSRGGWYQGGNLIILLVILPLSVGGLAVCLVFVNYICKMS
ncbi:hypothetical protein M3Y94_00435200 [Aphelenchoides besseyi]|nr:hypothetical protein M3Y94_00435200 [Aphelenchoides besseyi]